MEPSTSSFQRVRSQNDAGTQTVIGFEDDARRLVEQLLGGKKQLQFISVVGMAGLGKTTLVRKVFNEPSIEYHFYVRAWTTVTQDPKKRDLLLGILKSGFNVGNKNESDMELSETLKKRLSGQRYLLVMDDIWDSKDWNNLTLCFPDDNNGSRIVFTTRLADVPLQVQPGCYLHPLRFLNEKESWDLLRYKVFLDESCPSSLVEIGLHIARKCHGLPLLIVVIAGILANDTTTRWWSQVAQDVSSITSNAPEHYLDTLVLSYNHLPDHLKPCFLYFRAFPEDYEIPAWKLILLWVAEGFIKIQTAENNLEDEGNNLVEEVAARYLKELITRSLVIVSKSRSDGGIKSCIVHDALRDLCIKKSDEVNFLHQMPTFNKNESIDQYFVSKVETTTSTRLVQRLYSREADGKNFIRQLVRYFHLEPPSTPTYTAPNFWLCFAIPRAVKRIKYITKKNLYPNVQTILAYNGSGNSFVKVRYMRCYFFNVLRVFKFLRVMDLSSIGLSNIPVVIESLLELRYIALCIKAYDQYDPVGFRDSSNTPISICRLKHLETLILDNENMDYTYLPQGVFALNRLRHLIIKGAFSITYLPDNLQTLSYLQTLSLPYLFGCMKILEITPNLRKLSINDCLYQSFIKLTIHNLSKLQHLESLTLQNNLRSVVSGSDNLRYRELSSPNMFPVTLKKLTLGCTFLKWDEMEKIGMLPNLEVLKLQYEAFRGEHWETNDGGFRRLKHLSFKFMRIVQWSAYSDQFPNLQHLKLDECKQLEEIPFDIGDIYTLEMIEIRNCHPAVVQIARKIKIDQMNKGNDLLKVSIFQE